MSSRFLFAVVILIAAASASRAQDVFKAISNDNADAVARMLKADPKLANKPNHNGELPLHDALRGSNFKIVELLVNAGADVKAFDAHGCAPIHRAASNKNKKMIELLIAQGAKIDVPTKTGGFTPLDTAASSGHKHIVALLLDKGARLEGGFHPDQFKPRWTPLHSAVAGEHYQVVEFLLAKGADPNVMSEPRDGTPFDEAVRTGDLDMIRLLLAHGANVHSASAFALALQNGDRALIELFLKRGIDVKKPDHLCVAAGTSKEIVELLLDRGANPRNLDAQRRSPLAVAARYGKVESVALLLARGADAKNSDADKRTPLHDAATVEVAELLLAKGADVNAIDKNGCTPMSQALQYQRLQVAECLAKRGAKLDADSFAALGRADELRLYLKKNGLPNRRNDHQFAPLHFAAYHGRTEAVAVLLDSGVDVNLTVGDGDTPLHLAASRGHKATAELLLKKGAELNAKTQGMTYARTTVTPLDLALTNGHVEMVRFLVSKGALPMLEGAVEKRAWEIAAERKHLAMLRYFLEHGMPVNVILGQPGRTPLSVAAEVGDLEFVKELIAQGADMKMVSALHVAACAGQKAVVEYLVTKGADLHESYLLRHAVYHRRTAVVDFLLSKGAKVDQDDSVPYGGLLREAVKGDQLDMVAVLLARGADAKKDPHLLHYAVLRGQKAIVEALLAAGAEVNAPSTLFAHDLYSGKFQKRPEVLDFFKERDLTKLRGVPGLAIPAIRDDDWGHIMSGTPLHAAVAGRDRDIVALLLSKGAKVDVKLPAGAPLLHLAAYLGDVETATVLLANKADVNAKDAAGLTALKLVEREGRKEMVALLRKEGAKD